MTSPTQTPASFQHRATSTRRIRVLHPRLHVWATFGEQSTVALCPGDGAADDERWLARMIMGANFDEPGAREQYETAKRTPRA